MNNKLEKKDQKSVVAYFQFAKELDLPVFLKVDFSVFDKNLNSLLKELHFSEISEEKDCQKKVFEALKKGPYGRLLILEEATPIVARQIDSALETDKYGLESITPKSDHKVYRHKGEALMVYSFSSVVWQVGCFSAFGSGKNSSGARTVINRYLSWALAPFGIIGFWGVPVDEGIVVLRNQDSKGEAIFIDVAKQNIITQDGIKKIKGRFNILKLDSTLKGRNIRMTSEELIAFLTSHTTYFDYMGISMAMRFLIQELSKSSQGLVHPRENFKPRTDLSL